jgi:hypothetical protein
LQIIAKLGTKLCRRRQWIIAIGLLNLLLVNLRVHGGGVSLPNQNIGIVAAE